MGKTHFRSDVIEEGSRTASFSAITGGTVAVSGGAGSYIKLGSVYVISAVPLGTAFTKATLHAAATLALGVTTAAEIPRGTLFLNASAGMGALQAAYVKIAPASWSGLTTASVI
jgi:hypothetical protein